MRRKPAAIIDYLIHYHGSRDWFECHEILENYWKRHPDAANADTLVGLIQVAVGMYHERRGNRAGAVKMLRSSLNKLDPQQLEELGLDGMRLPALVRERLDALEASVPAGGCRGVFKEMDLPFADPELEAYCRQQSEARGWGWKRPSPLHEDELIHRHTRRDRSGVVREREESKRRRQQRQEEKP
jgi:predicted metal-dependent hydrolase